MPNPETIDSTELPRGERLSKKADSSSRKAEQRKAVQDLPSTQSPVSSAQAAVMKNSISTTYVPARPLKQVMPSARNLELSAPSGATDVEVEVKIDEEGRVTEARVVNNRSNNSELLTSAALAAAKEWIFEPAKVHGKSVPGDHTIEFHFHPQVGQQ
jgi:TonB family protein